MNFPIENLTFEKYPLSLTEIPKPPKQLFLRGSPVTPETKKVAVIGARRHSVYGKQVCEKIISGLASYPITIISGLAIGIDALAHEYALQAGLNTIAVVGSGLDDTVLYPRSNRPLARRILEQGGTLISELAPKTRAAKYTFPSRNRIMAGLSDLVIAVECSEQSGTRITTRLATDYNREVAAVPHPVFSETGAGNNALLQDGAHLIRNGEDVAKLLNLDLIETPQKDLSTLTDEERVVYVALSSPKTKTALAHEVSLPTQAVQVALAGLEMKGMVVEALGLLQRQ